MTIKYPAGVKAPTAPLKEKKPVKAKRHILSAANRGMVLENELNDSHGRRDVDGDVANSKVIVPIGIEVGEWPAVKKNHRDGDHLEDGLKFAEDVRGNDGSFGRSDQPERIDDEVSANHDDDAGEGDESVVGTEVRERQIDKGEIDEKLISDWVKEFAHIGDEVIFSRDLAIKHVG